jgi:succinate dehydrogenase/fumarate reductase flavoprotein subunit
MKRKESRGLHVTTDYRLRDDEHFLHDTVLED